MPFKNPRFPQFYRKPVNPKGPTEDSHPLAGPPQTHWRCDMEYKQPTPAQVARLVSASHTLAAYFASDACRVIFEGGDDMNLVSFLENLPVKVVREFDAAIYAITNLEMENEDAEIMQRRKYEAAMSELANSPHPTTTAGGE